MKIMSDPEPPGARPRRRPRVDAGEDRLAFIERTIKAIETMQDYYNNMRVDDWGKLPEPVKIFLQACGMSKTTEARGAARQLAQALDKQQLRPEQIPLEIRKAISKMI